MDPPEPSSAQGLSFDVWSRHPDALILAAAGDVVDANPTTEQLFGYSRSWLVGKPTTVLIPRSVLVASPPAAGFPYRARRRDGRAFIAAASLVAGATTGGRDDLIVVRDVTGLADSLDPDGRAGCDDRVTRLEARERALEIEREKLTQALFGAGIALRSCLRQGSSGQVSRACVERAIDALDTAMADLDGP